MIAYVLNGAIKALNLNFSLSRQQDRYVAVFAAIVCFCAYVCIFSYRKAFNVAPFAGHVLWGIDYKIILVITQVFGYMLSKFYGIRFIAELKREHRGRLIIVLTGISWLSWLLFALIPPPYNFWCLFFNGFPLGMLWGVIISYVEGRRATDFIGAALAVSFIFGSGFAKSVAQGVMRIWDVSEYWMPFVVGLIFFLPLLFFVYFLEKIPPPSAEDIRQRIARVPMDAAQRKLMLSKFFPGLAILVFIYILVTILREVRDSFMADMWRESGEQLAITSFAQTETLISFAGLLLIALMVLIRNNLQAFLWSQAIMLMGFILAGVSTAVFVYAGGSVFWWMTGVGLGLYMVYIPYNSNLFDRFISAFQFSGNVGFLIYVADSFGYLGSVGVLLAKSVYKVQLRWLDFYTLLVMVTSITGVAGTLISMLYFSRKYHRWKAGS